MRLLANQNPYVLVGGEGCAPSGAGCGAANEDIKDRSSMSNRCA